MYTSNIDAGKSIMSLAYQLFEMGRDVSISHHNNLWGNYVAVSVDEKLSEESYHNGSKMKVDNVDGIYVPSITGEDKILHHEWRFHYEYYETLACPWSVIR